MKALLHKKWIFVIAFALGFLGYELWSLWNMRPQVWMEDHIAIFSSQSGQTLVMGENLWFEDHVTSNLGSLLKLPQINHWKDLQVGNQYHWGDLSAAKLDPNLGLIDLGGSRFFVLMGAFPDWEVILSESVDFESDFWLLWDNVAPDNIPIPKQSIIVLNKKLRKPKAHTLAHEEAIPFLWVKNTGQILLQKQNDWQVKTNH